MYFSMFPQMIYTLDDYQTGQLVVDFLRRIQLSKELKNTSAFFDEYDVQDGETPESVASHIYGDTQFHWIVMLANEIIDPRYDWPQSQANLIEYCKSKYGDSNLYASHHYVNSKGYEVNSDATEAFSVSNFQFEDELNETKRRIKLIKPEVVSELVNNFEELINR